ncbi:hypothetical protein JL721_5884 [Aureococcus anophagefferens]|nr:hypothetical protein JL721_5884 [Aureococcus anophagefferens]
MSRRSARDGGPPGPKPSPKLMSELEDICKQTGAEILKPGESVNLEKIQSKDGPPLQGARGNDAFAAGDNGKALKEYLGACWLLRRKTGQFPKSITPASPDLPRGVDAIAIVDFDLDDAANHDDWALVARVTDLRRLAHLNIAAAAVKLKDWDLAEHVCTRVLGSDGVTAVQRNKARFRLAEARDGKSDLAGAFKQLNAVCADADCGQGQYREARKLADFLRKRDPPVKAPHPYPVTHVRRAGDTRPLYEPPKRTEEEKRRMVRPKRKPGESDLEAELRELKKGVDITKPKPPPPEKVPYKGKELYPEEEMRTTRAEARSDRTGRDQRARTTSTSRR